MGSCRDTNIGYVHNVVGFRYQSIVSSLIRKVSGDVYCLAPLSCAATSISEVNTIYVSINNDNTDTIDIYCVCSQFYLVNCDSSGAWSKVRLLCRESCFTICDDEGGIECPAVLNFSSDTPSPTVERDCELVVVTDAIAAGISTTVMAVLLISMGALCVLCMGDRVNITKKLTVIMVHLINHIDKVNNLSTSDFASSVVDLKMNDQVVCQAKSGAQIVNNNSEKKTKGSTIVYEYGLIFSLCKN